MNEKIIAETICKKDGSLLEYRYNYDTWVHVRFPDGTSYTYYPDDNLDNSNDSDKIEERGWITKNGRHIYIGDDGGSNGNVSGAISGALKPDSERAEKHAFQYYEAVRKMKTDCKRIAKNTGFDESEIQQVKDFIFMQKHDLGDGKLSYFYPSYEMAQSWQRLIDGKNIQKHDITLIRHELMEQRLMQQGLSQREAHMKTEKVYNYGKESRDYYDKNS